jgi:hypothetical protein
MHEAGVYGKEPAATGGSMSMAVNSREWNFTTGKLRDRTGHLGGRIEEYLKELEENDGKESAGCGEKSAEEIKRIAGELSVRKAWYESCEEELERNGETQKLLTDGESRLMVVNGKIDVCYNVQTAVDAKHKLVVELEVTSKGTDYNQLTPVVGRTKTAMGTETLAAVADAGYDSAQDIAGSMTQGAVPHAAGTDFDMCVPTEEAETEAIVSQKDGQCVYPAKRNLAVCPMGKTLYPSFYRKFTKQGVFYNREACKGCGCKCTKEGMQGHQGPVTEEDFSKPCNDTGLSVKQVRIKADEGIIRRRKSIVEHPFETIKRGMEAGYYLTRGLRTVTGEFSLTFPAYNLKRIINIPGCQKLTGCLTGQVFPKPGITREHASFSNNSDPSTTCGTKF